MVTAKDFIKNHAIEQCSASLSWLKDLSLFHTGRDEKCALLHLARVAVTSLYAYLSSLAPATKPSTERRDVILIDSSPPVKKIPKMLNYFFKLAAKTTQLSVNSAHASREHNDNCWHYVFHY